MQPGESEALELFALSLFLSAVQGLDGRGRCLSLSSIPLSDDFSLVSKGLGVTCNLGGLAGLLHAQISPFQGCLPPTPSKEPLR